LQEVESLRGELKVKDELIAAHVEKLGAWRQELSRLQAMQGVVAEVCVRRPRPRPGVAAISTKCTEVPQAQKSGRTLWYIMYRKLKGNVSQILHVLYFSTFCISNGSHSDRATAIPDRANYCKMLG
jgi:hypothetical protein